MCGIRCVWGPTHLDRHHQFGSPKHHINDTQKTIFKAKGFEDHPEKAKISQLQHRIALGKPPNSR